MIAEAVPFTAGPNFTDGIYRHESAEIRSARYYRDYVLALKPVITRGAFDHWPARGKWNLHFLRDVHGNLRITIDSNHRKLGEFIDEVLASTPDRPAPYLHNHLMALWPDELRATISPMPDCTRPNWLEDGWFPSRTRLTYTEAYIGGPGARFPVLHYDGLSHTCVSHANQRREGICSVPLPDESESLSEGATYPKSMLKTPILNITRYLPVRLVFDLSFILGKHSSYLRVGGILLASSLHRSQFPSTV